MLMNEQAIHKKNKNISEIIGFIFIVVLYLILHSITFNMVDTSKSIGILSLLSKETKSISFFHFSLTPYILSTFVFELFGWIIPAIKLNKREGFAGTIKNKKIMRYIAYIITVLFSVFYIYLVIKYQLYYTQYSNIIFYLITYFILTIGSISLISVVDTLTKFSLISGMSTIIFAQYILVIKDKYYDYIDKTKDLNFYFKDYKIEYIALFALIIVVLFFNLYIKRIYVFYPIKENLYKKYSNLKINIPLKMNSSGMFSVLLTSFIVPIIQYCLGQELPTEIYIAILFFVCYLLTFAQANYKNIVNVILKNNGDVIANRHGLNIETYIALKVILYSFFVSCVLCSIFILCEISSKLILVDTGVNIASLIIVSSNIILEIIRNIILNIDKDYYLSK